MNDSAHSPLASLLLAAVGAAQAQTGKALYDAVLRRLPRRGVIGAPEARRCRGLEAAPRQGQGRSWSRTPSSARPRACRRRAAARICRDAQIRSAVEYMIAGLPAPAAAKAEPKAPRAGAGRRGGAGGTACGRACRARRRLPRHRRLRAHRVPPLRPRPPPPRRGSGSRRPRRGERRVRRRRRQRLQPPAQAGRRLQPPGDGIGHPRPGQRRDADSCSRRRARSPACRRARPATTSTGSRRSRPRRIDPRWDRNDPKAAGGGDGPQHRARSEGLDARRRVPAQAAHRVARLLQLPPVDLHSAEGRQPDLDGGDPARAEVRGVPRQASPSRCRSAGCATRRRRIPPPWRRSEPMRRALQATLAALAVALATGVAAQTDPRRSVEQKIDFVGTLVTRSPLAARINASPNEQAREFLKQSVEHHQMAITALKVGDLEGAEREANQAHPHRRQGAPAGARRHAPRDRAAACATRSCYRSVEMLVASYERHRQATGRPADAEWGETLRLLDRARTPARVGTAGRGDRRAGRCRSSACCARCRPCWPATRSTTRCGSAARRRSTSTRRRVTAAWKTSCRPALKEFNPRPEARTAVDRHLENSRSIARTAHEQAAAGRPDIGLASIREATAEVQKALTATGLAIPQ